MLAAIAQVRQAASAMSAPPLLLLLLCTVLLIGGAEAADYRPQPFSARYSVHLNGFKVGELQRSLHVEADGRHVLEHVMETTGLVALFKKDRLVERSTWTYADGHAWPAGYAAEYRGRAKDTTEQIAFDWPRHAAIYRRQDEVQEVALTTGMLDKLMHQAMLCSDIASGKETLDYTVLDRGEVKTYAYQLLGVEELVTARGRVNTIKVTRKTTTLWLAPEWDYLLVQLVQNNDDGTIATYIQKQQ
jgi:hypothetical protein